MCCAVVNPGRLLDGEAIATLVPETLLFLGGGQGQCSFEQELGTDGAVIDSFLQLQLQAGLNDSAFSVAAAA